MHLEHVATSGGIVERAFISDGVSGTLWSPAFPLGAAPLALVERRSPGEVRASHPGIGAEHLVGAFGVHAAAIDLPGQDEFAVWEWRWAIDGLRGLPSIDAERPVGMALRAGIGLQLAAAEPRIGVAVLTVEDAREEARAVARGIRVPVRIRLTHDDLGADPRDDAWFIAQRLLAPGALVASER